MEEVKKRKVKRSTLLRISLAAFLVYVVATLISLQVQINEKREELEDIQQQIMIKEITNENMDAALESGDEAYIEQVAQEELDYAKPGERILLTCPADNGKRKIKEESGTLCGWKLGQFWKEKLLESQSLARLWNCPETKQEWSIFLRLRLSL